MMEKSYHWLVGALGVALGFWLTSMNYRAGIFGFHLSVFTSPYEVITDAPFLDFLYVLWISLGALWGIKVPRLPARPLLGALLCYLCAILLTEAWFGGQDYLFYRKAMKNPEKEIQESRVWPAPFGEHLYYSPTDGFWVMD